MGSNPNRITITDNQLIELVFFILYLYIMMKNNILIASLFCLLLLFQACRYDDTQPIRAAIERQMATYPETTLQDVYKSFYQAHFGPGHLIADTASARNYLVYELSEMTDKSAIYYEPTGSEGRFVRVYLSAIADSLISAEQLLDAFVRSANMSLVSTMNWETEWHQVVETIMKYDIQVKDFEADTAVLREASQHQQAIHHSRAYNAAYHPHYRIVERAIFEKELKPQIDGK